MSSNQFQSLIKTDLVATILSGQTASDAIDLSGCELVGLIMPAAFTGTSIKILSSPTLGGTYQNIYPSGADYSMTVAASKNIPVENLAIMAGWRFIKLVSSGAEGADRSITLAVRPV